MTKAGRRLLPVRRRHSALVQDGRSRAGADPNLAYCVSRGQR